MKLFAGTILIFTMCWSSANSFCIAQTIKRYGQSVSSKKIETISYCQFFRAPLKYKNRLVRLTIDYFTGFEVSAIEDFNCDQNRSTWLDFANEYQKNTSKILQEQFKKATGPLIRQEKNGIEMRSYRVKFQVLGKFIVAKKIKKIGKQYESQNGFGHMSQYPFEFKLLKIEKLFLGENA